MINQTPLLPADKLLRLARLGHWAETIVRQVDVMEDPTHFRDEMGRVALADELLRLMTRLEAMGESIL